MIEKGLICAAIFLLIVTLPALFAWRIGNTQPPPLDDLTPDEYELMAIGLETYHDDLA